MRCIFPQKIKCSNCAMYEQPSHITNLCYQCYNKQCRRCGSFDTYTTFKTIHSKPFEDNIVECTWCCSSCDLKKYSESVDVQL